MLATRPFGDSEGPAVAPRRFTCPVCYFDRMTDPPQDFHICPSCGTEFELDDAGPDIEARRAELRAFWVSGGCRWWSILEPKPADWVSPLSGERPQAIETQTESVVAKS